MTRRRWIQIPGQGLVEVSPDAPTPINPHRADGVLWNDRAYDGQRTLDGHDISSRSKHRAYMKANNLTTADDFRQTWQKAAQQRADHYQTGGDHSARREAVERAIYQLQRR